MPTAARGGLLDRQTIRRALLQLAAARVASELTGRAKPVDTASSAVFVDAGLPGSTGARRASARRRRAPSIARERVARLQRTFTGSARHGRDVTVGDGGRARATRKPRVVAKTRRRGTHRHHATAGPLAQAPGAPSRRLAATVAAVAVFIARPAATRTEPRIREKRVRAAQPVDRSRAAYADGAR